MEVSLRYPPVQGRLHTRYAPVRRSPPGYCYPALPLDLHVLSLPLAFILSQDQTLHCMNCFSVPKLVRCPSPAAPAGSLTHAVSRSHHFNVLGFLGRLRREAFFRRKRVQRYDLFPFRQIFFSLFPEYFSITPVAQHVAEEDFFTRKENTARKTGNRRASPDVFGGRGGRKFLDIYVYRYNIAIYIIPY